MPHPFDPLIGEPRLLMQVVLKPLQGARFQPTGFADLGPARYRAYRGDDLIEMLLVESTQSIANCLEAMCWEPPQLGRVSNPAAKLAPELEGMPYVVVKRPDGSVLTNSILESHRLNSPYILEGKDTTVLNMLKQDVAGMEKGPVDIRKLAGVVFKYDANAALHGIFLAKSELAGGRLRMPRLLSGFIEASDVEDAASGGVKNDHVDPSGDTKRGFGNVPFHRTEFTARQLVVYFNLDLAQLRAYGLGTPAESFLIALALFKIQRFLKVGLRLRTACDLEPCGSLEIARPSGFQAPTEQQVKDTVKATLAACRDEGLFAKPPVTSVTYEPVKKKDAKKDEDDEQTD